MYYSAGIAFFALICLFIYPRFYSNPDIPASEKSMDESHLTSVKLKNNSQLTDTQNISKEFINVTPFEGAIISYFDDVILKAKYGDYAIGLRLASKMHSCEIGDKEIANDYKDNEARGWDKAWLAERTIRLDAHAFECDGLKSKHYSQISDLITSAKIAGYDPAIIFDAKRQIEKSTIIISNSDITPKELSELAKKEIDVTKSMELLASNGNVQAMEELVKINLRVGAAPTDFLTAISYRLISDYDWKTKFVLDTSTLVSQGISESDMETLSKKTLDIYEKCCHGRQKNALLN